MTTGDAKTASQWEGRPWSLIACLVALVVAAVLAYRTGVPLVASAVATRLPQSVSDTIGAAVLASLDGHTLQPSALTADRQRQLVTQFEQFVSRSAEALRHRPDGATGYRVIFRKSAVIGPNAMALPSGTIVVTDPLVSLARDDREILGVLAHEAGHVERRHGLRLVVQSSTLGLLMGWFIGDFNSLLAAAPAALLEAKYSRDFEREADSYAVSVLRANDIPVRYLAAILERLEASQPHGGASAQALAYLSTHPATEERLERLRAQ